MKKGNYSGEKEFFDLYPHDPDFNDKVGVGPFLTRIVLPRQEKPDAKSIQDNARTHRRNIHSKAENPGTGTIGIKVQAGGGSAAKI